MNAEYCLMGIVLNYPEYWKELCKSGNIFLNKICNEIYSILESERGNFNKQTVLDIIKSKHTITEFDFYEVYQSAYEEAQFKIYYEYVLTQYSRQKLFTMANEIYKKQIKSIDEMRNDIQEIVMKLDLGVSNDNVCAKVLIQELADQEHQIKMIDSQIPFIDGFGGLETTDFVIIAARPSVGKTSIMLEMIEHDVIQSKYSVGIFSIEVQNKRLLMSLACKKAGVNEWKLKTGLINDWEKQKYYEAFQHFYREDIYFGNVFDISLMEQKIKKMVRDGCRKIYIDYLGLIAGGQGHNQNDRIGNISGRLKRLAKELNVPIITLCQLNRESAKNDRPPIMADLRDSGSLEQDADVIILLSKKNDVEGKPFEIIMDIDIAKNRNNPVGHQIAHFNKSIRKIKFYKDSEE